MQGYMCVRGNTYPGESHITIIPVSENMMLLATIAAFGRAIYHVVVKIEIMSMKYRTAIAHAVPLHMNPIISSYNVNAHGQSSWSAHASVNFDPCSTAVLVTTSLLSQTQA